jgi:hypothetical protein
MRQLAPDLLLHPILDEAEALTGVPNREVVHPSIEDIHRLAGNDRLVAITAKAHDWEDKFNHRVATRQTAVTFLGIGRLPRRNPPYTLGPARLYGWMVAHFAHRHLG